VTASGYDDSRLGRPTAERLDEACGGRPLWMVHCSNHAGMVNTAAIRRMGYRDPRDLPDVEGGLVERHPDGRPTGFVAELAVNLVTGLLRPVPQDDLVSAIGLAAEEALRHGLTSVAEPGICGALTGNGPSDLAAFQAARDRGLLGVRVTVMPEMPALHEIANDAPGGAGFGLDLGVRTGLGDDWLRIGAVKVFSDGALSARTAAMVDDYADRPGVKGFLREDPAVLRRSVVAAHRAGWQVATHAIGDAAIDVVLDAYEEAQRAHPRPDARHRVEHCGVAGDGTIRRIRALGVIPVPQGRFMRENGEAYVRAVGAERGRLLYRQRSFVDAGIELPGSSDCPVVDGAPLGGIDALVNRTVGADERLTPEQALRAYTYGSAYANHQESRRGTLARGKLADFTVLSDDLLAVPAERIGSLGVQATVVGGVVRYGFDALRVT
jgi:predicted amidohydrolase YtcJ